MANRRFDADFRTIGDRRIRLAGSFVPLTGAGTVVASTVKGFGFGYAPASGTAAMTLKALSSVSPLTGTPGIVRANTGLYTVTLEDTYLALDSIQLAYGVPAAGLTTLLDVYHVPLADSFGSATAVSSFQVVLLNTSGNPTDAVAACRVHFILILRDSTVQFSKP